MLLICAKVVYLKLSPLIYFIEALTAWLHKFSTAYLEEQTSSQSTQVPDTDSPSDELQPRNAFSLKSFFI